MEEIYGYARVSTQEQALNTHALEQQIERLKQAGCAHIYVDIVSGSKSERPQFSALMALVRQGKVKKIRAVRWDRLTRNEELYLELKKAFQASGVQLKLLDQGEVDLSTAAGELSADMQAIFAVHERRLLRERVKHGFKHRRSRSAASGRAPFGYISVNDKYELNTQPCICLLADRPANYLELYLEPDYSQKLLSRSKAQIAQEIFEVFLEIRKPRKVLKYFYEKYGIRTKKGVNSGIADELVLPRSATHFREWLINPIHQGHTAYLKYQQKGELKDEKDWEFHRDTHPSQKLIDEEQAAEIKDILKFNSKRVGRADKTFYLTGLVFCEQCGGKAILKRNAGYGYYGCRHASLGCNNTKSTRLEKIDRLIIEALFRRAIAISQEPKAQANCSLDSAQLLELKEQLAGLNAVPGIDNNRLLRNARDELVNKIDRETQRLEQFLPIEGTAQQIINHPKVRNINFWYTLTESEREAIYYKLVERVSILDGEVISVSLQV